MDLTAPGTDLKRYAIAGVAPKHAVRPSTRAEAESIVRDADRDGLRVLPWGGGIGLSRDAAPERYDVALDLSALERIVTYDPDDFTITAEAGVKLDALRATLQAQRQALPLEGAEAWGATLGGVLASNASGPRRRALGGPRDRLLGARFVTGDGVAARTGGRVVKNVAGLALHRLLCGSRGGLAVLLECSLKLSPLPLSRVALVQALDAATLRDARRWDGFARREPAVLTVIGRALSAPHPVLACDAPYTLVSGFEDDAAWTADCAAFARERLGAPKLKLQDDSAGTLWQNLNDLEEMPGPRLTFTSAHVTPDALAPLLDSSVAERLLFHAPAGRLHVWPQPEEAGELAARLAASGFALLEARGLPAQAPQSPPRVQALRARVRAALDPRGTLAYGTRWERAGG